MYTRIFVLFVLFSSLLGCAQANTPLLSGPVARVADFSNAPGLRIGFLADSQLQTRANANLIFGYRHVLADKIVETAIRPPALDWAARSLLRSNLKHLKAGGADALFYLGDGANNACYDELVAGFEDNLTPKENDKGLFKILDDFRKAENVPIYFVLGNHDLLGAGSTAQTVPNEKFCQGSVGSQLPLPKVEVMRLAERFNQGNARFNDWKYRSSYNANLLSKACGVGPEGQHRDQGCFLAATVNYTGGPRSAQFLLLDTNDWSDVSPSLFFSMQQEGLRGAMSFRDGFPNKFPSQTRWFNENASTPVALRIAVSHYDVSGLRKKHWTGIVPSSKSQHFFDLFTDDAYIRSPIQQSAYVVTAHTHTPEPDLKSFMFSINCDLLSCNKTSRFMISELNVGSTTDYSNYSVLAQFGLGDGIEGAMAYRRIESEPASCSAVYEEVAGHEFPNALGVERRGWAAIGVDRAKSYRQFDFDKLTALWGNLDSYAANDSLRANCIGLYAAAIEKDVYPLNHLPSKF